MNHSYSHPSGRGLKFASPVLLAAAVVAVVWVGAGDLAPPPGAIQPTNRVQLNAQSVTLPYVIANPGSYVLTSNLTGTVGNDGILINADDVTLDLNGFALAGLGGEPADGDGIRVNDARLNITVRNGIIRGWHGNGIYVPGVDNARFEALTISDNVRNGIELGSNSVVRGLSITGNGEAGIHVVGDGNRIEANHLTTNAIGIDVDGEDNLIVRNSARANTVDYDIGAGNAYGPIVNVGGIGDITVVPNADHPWANFSMTCFPATWCLDYDGDGYGDAGNTTESCTPPMGYVPDCTDCDDTQTSVYPGAEETCDGLDNDCDTVVDEDNPGGGGSCNTGLPGVCASGTLQCQAGALTCVPDTEPSPEICDGLDNDCDGAADEGNPGGGGSCNTGLLGVCASGTLQCQAGALTCVPDTEPSPEICDGLDNDCDGQIDEGACPNGTACTTSTKCQSGNCIDGYCCNTSCGGTCEACDLAGSLGTCSLVPLGDDPDGECPPGGYCDGAGNCCKDNGQGCTGGAECCSTLCVDDVCCNNSCGGLCQACDLAGSLGICSFVPLGQDPDGECLGGDCDGTGACCLSNGEGCTGDPQCCSGNCILSVCVP